MTFTTNATFGHFCTECFFTFFTSTISARMVKRTTPRYMTEFVTVVTASDPALTLWAELDILLESWNKDTIWTDCHFIRTMIFKSYSDNWHRLSCICINKSMNFYELYVWISQTIFQGLNGYIYRNIPQISIYNTSCSFWKMGFSITSKHFSWPTVYHDFKAVIAGPAGRRAPHHFSRRVCFPPCPLFLVLAHFSLRLHLIFNLLMQSSITLVARVIHRPTKPRCENIEKQRNYYNDSYHTYGPCREKTWRSLKAKIKGAEQPTHPCSLISAFVVCPIESIIDKLATRKNSVF